MVVAFGAAERRAEPRSRDIAHPVGGILEEVFLGLRSPLGAHHPQPVVGRGNALIERVAGKEIAGKLLAREAVERHVFREGPDHPVAVGPHRHLLIAVVADRIGVADQIEPPGGHPFGMGGAGEEPVDVALERLLGRIGEEGIDLGGLRGQAGEIERDTAGKRRPIGGVNRLDPLTGKRSLDEGVDGRAGSRRHRPNERPVGPVPLIGSTGGDPGLDLLALLRRHDLVRVRRGHDDVGIGGAEPLEEHARLRVPGHNRRAAVARRGGSFEGVEAEIGLAVGRIGPVAGEAGVGEDREDVAVEPDSRRNRGFGGMRPRPSHRADSDHEHEHRRRQPPRPPNRRLPDHGHASTLLSGDHPKSFQAPIVAPLARALQHQHSPPRGACGGPRGLARLLTERRSIMMPSLEALSAWNGASHV